MTKEKVEARKQFLQEAFEEAKIHTIALQVGIKECEYWLAELEKGEETPPTPNEIA